jgi:hypothetical protein
MPTGSSRDQGGPSGQHQPAASVVATCPSFCGFGADFGINRSSTTGLRRDVAASGEVPLNDETARPDCSSGSESWLTRSLTDRFGRDCAVVFQLTLGGEVGRPQRRRLVDGGRRADVTRGRCGVIQNGVIERRSCCHTLGS